MQVRAIFAFAIAVGLSGICRAQATGKDHDGPTGAKASSKAVLVPTKPCVSSTTSEALARLVPDEAARKSILSLFNKAVADAPAGLMESAGDLAEMANKQGVHPAILLGLLGAEANSLEDVQWEAIAQALEDDFRRGGDAAEVDEAPQGWSAALAAYASLLPLRRLDDLVPADKKVSAQKQVGEAVTAIVGATDQTAMKVAVEKLFSVEADLKIPTGTLRMLLHIPAFQKQIKLRSKFAQLAAAEARKRSLNELVEALTSKMDVPQFAEALKTQEGRAFLLSLQEIRRASLNIAGNADKLATLIARVGEFARRHGASFALGSALFDGAKSVCSVNGNSADEKRRLVSEHFQKEHREKILEAAEELGLTLDSARTQSPAFLDALTRIGDKGATETDLRRALIQVQSAIQSGDEGANYSDALALLGAVPGLKLAPHREQTLRSISKALANLDGSGSVNLRSVKDETRRAELAHRIAELGKVTDRKEIVAKIKELVAAAREAGLDLKGLKAHLTSDVFSLDKGKQRFIQQALVLESADPKVREAALKALPSLEGSGWLEYLGGTDKVSVTWLSTATALTNIAKDDAAVKAMLSHLVAEKYFSPTQTVEWNKLLGGAPPERKVASGATPVPPPKKTESIPEMPKKSETTPATTASGGGFWKSIIDIATKIAAHDSKPEKKPEGQPEKKPDSKPESKPTQVAVDPKAADPTLLQIGLNRCLSCHGEKGRGGIKIVGADWKENLAKLMGITKSRGGAATLERMAMEARLLDDDGKEPAQFAGVYRELKKYLEHGIIAMPVSSSGPSPARPATIWDKPSPDTSLAGALEPALKTLVEATDPKTVPHRDMLVSVLKQLKSGVIPGKTAEQQLRLLVGSADSKYQQEMTRLLRLAQLSLKDTPGSQTRLATINGLLASKTLTNALAAPGGKATAPILIQANQPIPAYAQAISTQLFGPAGPQTFLPGQNPGHALKLVDAAAGVFILVNETFKQGDETGFAWIQRKIGDVPKLERLKLLDPAPWAEGAAVEGRHLVYKNKAGVTGRAWVAQSEDGRVMLVSEAVDENSAKPDAIKVQELAQVKAPTAEDLTAIKTSLSSPLPKMTVSTEPSPSTTTTATTSDTKPAETTATISTELPPPPPKKTEEKPAPATTTASTDATELAKILEILNSAVPQVAAATPPPRVTPTPVAAVTPKPAAAVVVTTVPAPVVVRVPVQQNFVVQRPGIFFRRPIFGRRR